MLTQDQEKQLKELFSCGLTCGIGDREKTCIEGALCLVLYGELSDEHRGADDCRSAAVVRASIILNDAEWSSPTARAKGLWPLALAQIGSAGIDEQKIAKRYAELTIRKLLPIVLRKAGLEQHASRCEAEGTEKAASATARAIYDASADDVVRAAYGASSYAAEGASYADYDTESASYSVARTARAADAVSVYAAPDEILSLSASLLVQAIQEAR